MADARLEINFQEMKKLSEGLSETAKKVKQESDVAGLKILSGIKASWISPCADIFAGKEVKVLERIGEISMELDELSRDIYDRAKFIYDMEQRNVLLTGQIGHVFI